MWKDRGGVQRQGQKQGPRPVVSLPGARPHQPIHPQLSGSQPALGAKHPALRELLAGVVRPSRGKKTEGGSVPRHVMRARVWSTERPASSSRWV